MLKAGQEITFLPDFSAKTGSRCRLHIQNDFMCTQAVFRPAATTEQIPEIVPYNEQYIKSFLPEKKEAINQTENIEEVINVFPNPAKTAINVIFDAISQAQTIQLIDVLGKVITEQNTQSNQSQITFDVSNLSTGVYFIKNNNNTVKFIKE